MKKTENEIVAREREYTFFSENRREKCKAVKIMS